MEKTKAIASVAHSASVRMLTTRDAASHLGVSASFLNKLRLYGGGPTFVKIGRSVRYRPLDLENWVRPRLRATTHPHPSSA